MMFAAPLGMSAGSLSSHSNSKPPGPGPVSGLGSRSGISLYPVRRTRSSVRLQQRLINSSSDNTR